jgi:hypothetical protein
MSEPSIFGKGSPTLEHLLDIMRHGRPLLGVGKDGPPPFVADIAPLHVKDRPWRIGGSTP